MRVEILDSTLREGELFRVLPTDAKVRVASKLAEAGIKRIELTVHYPSRTKFEDNEAVVKALKGTGVLIVMHGRALLDDLEAMAKYDVEGCAVYVAVSRLHREHKLHGLTYDEAVERLCNAAEIAKEHGFKYIRVTFEDVSRIFLEEGENRLPVIQAAIERVKEHGATTVSLPDTSGLLTPRSAGAFFQRMKQLSTLPLAAHFHNDYGLASANTIEAAIEGADELHVTLLGVGDRNGIADLYEVVATLEDVYGMHTGVQRSSLKQLYSTFSKIAGMPIPSRHPLSDEARTIRAGVHQSMTVKRTEGYIPAKKLVNDFDRPLYVLNPFLSHKLVRKILAPHFEGLEDGTAHKIAEALAALTHRVGHRAKREEFQRIMREEAGVEVPYEELAEYFGGQTVYILMKLRAQYPAQRIVQEVASWNHIESVDEVYGDVDMVVKARTPNPKEDVVAKLRRDFSEAIQELRVLVAD